MLMIFLYIKDQDKVRIQHDDHVLVLLGSCTTKECKTEPVFYTYVQRKLEKGTTVADAIAKEEIYLHRPHYHQCSRPKVIVLLPLKSSSSLSFS